MSDACVQVLHLIDMVGWAMSEMGALGDMRQSANQAVWNFPSLAENNR